MPAVSVIMSVYNAKKFLAVHSIPSILNQTFQDFEFVIIDDGSTDGSQDIIQDFADKDKRIRPLYLEKNVGIARARNVGLALAVGKYMAVIDADDIAMPHRLEKQYQFMEQNPDYCFVGGYRKVVNIIDKNNPTIQIERYAEDWQKIQQELQTQSMASTHVLFFCKMSSIRKIGGYRLSYIVAEDMDLFFRLSELGEKMANLPEVVTEYYIHGDSSHEQLTLYKATEALAASWSFRYRQQNMPDFMEGRETPIGLEVLQYAKDEAHRRKMKLRIAGLMIDVLHKKEMADVFYQLWQEFADYDKQQAGQLWELQFVSSQLSTLMNYNRQYRPAIHNPLWQKLIEVAHGYRNNIQGWHQNLLAMKTMLAQRQQPTDWLEPYIKEFE